MFLLESIILKTRGNKPMPILSDSDKAIVCYIEQQLNEICGKSENSLKNITVFLLEAAGESDE